MKKIIGLIAVSLLLAACEAPVNTIIPEFHRAANAACEKNNGYEKLRVWTDQFRVAPNEHLVIVCNDKAEMFIARWGTAADGSWVLGEWESDNERFGRWE